jgi:hypothetical protein
LPNNNWKTVSGMKHVPSLCKNHIVFDRGHTMNSRNLKLAGIFVVLVMGILACDMGLFDTAPPQIYETPTPDLTKTAITELLMQYQTSEAADLATSTQPADSQSQPMAEDSGPTPEPLQPTETTPPTVPPPPTATTAPTETHTLTATFLPTITFTPSVTYSGADKRPGASISAARLHTSPVINGDLSDWSQSVYTANTVIYGGEHHVSEADLSATVMAGWDANYLYIGARVKDDAYVQISNGRYLYKGDSIEVMLDKNISGDYYYDVLSPDDYQLGVSPGNPNIGNHPEAYLWYPVAIRGWVPQVQVAVIGTGDGYQVELAIPWSMYNVIPYSGQHFGFAFSVSDNDLAGQAVQQTMISNVSTRRLTHPMTWGDLTLTD